MVELPNEIFSYFDSLVEKYGVEKIRAIGDNYMVASGVPTSRPDHAQRLAYMALEMRAYVQNRPPRYGKHLDFRIGINSGPVVAGVIGRRKFQYDLWGEPNRVERRRGQDSDQWSSLQEARVRELDFRGPTYAVRARPDRPTIARGCSSLSG